MVVPAEVRDKLGLRNGGTLILEERDGIVTLKTVDELVRDAQAVVRPYRPAPGSELASEAVIRERREEGGRDR
jgi:AbrB family looped-hinge helix DNA binding protein